jgi:hypothetical protein
MSNMSYVMFENTLRDLRECKKKLYEISGNLEQLSETEREAAQDLIYLCTQISHNFD